MLEGHGRVDSREPRNERQRRVPEREGITRMQPARRELTHRVGGGQARKLRELADTGEVKGPV